MSSSPTAVAQFLIVGNVSAGKTCLVRHFKRFCWYKSRKPGEGQPTNLPPNLVDLATTKTSGVERDEFTYKETAFVVKELGGCMKPTWSSYYDAADALIYVIDRSNLEALGSVSVDLLHLLHHPSLVNKPFLILLHKSDSSAALSRHELQCLIRLDDFIAFASAVSSSPTASSASSSSSSSSSAAPSSSSTSSSTAATVKTVIATATTTTTTTTTTTRAGSSPRSSSLTPPVSARVTLMSPPPRVQLFETSAIDGQGVPCLLNAIRTLAASKK